MPNVNLGAGGVTTFRELHNQLTPKQLGSDKHVRSGEQGQVLYSHAGLSGIGKEAAAQRALKLQAGATQVKQLVANEYGNAFADRVFSSLSQSKATRNIESEVTWKDLGRIKTEIERQKGLTAAQGGQGTAKPAFTQGVQDSINDKFGSGEGSDFSIPSKFIDGVHQQFLADAPRSNYKIGDNLLPRSAEGATAALREELNPEQLKAFTAVIHQGAPLAVIGRLAESGDGFIKGGLGPGESDKQEAETTYSLIGHGADGSMKVKIEHFMPVATLASMEDEPRHFDPDESSMRTVVHGEIRPGQDPLFVITQPIAYDLRLRDQE